MQPNPPQPESAQHGQPPMAGGPAQWDGGLAPMAAPPKPRANAAAAVTASILALATACMLVWFAFQDVIFLDNGLAGGLTGMVLVNVLGGAVGAGSVLTAAGFTFTRRIGGAWTLCGLCAFYTVANIVAAPLLWGTSIGDQLEWVFGFDRSNGTAVGLATIFGILTAVAAAIAGAVKSYELAVPPRP